MTNSTIPGLLPSWERAALVRSLTERSDCELLEQFVTLKSDAAFETLVRRYGPMVFGICRRVLHNAHDAEDAFQATFVVLLRKARSIVKRDSLAAWLHGVAYRIAIRAKSMSVRRHKSVRLDNDPAAWPDRIAPRAAPDWEAALDDAIRSLPAKYRVPILLCELEGRSRAEAARHLGLPEGTLSSRLSRARDLLRKRLVRNGVTVGVTALAALLAQRANVAASNLAVESLVSAVTKFGAGQAWIASVSGHAVSFADTMMKAFLLSKLKVTLAVVMGIGLIVPVAEKLVESQLSERDRLVAFADNVPRSEDVVAANGNPGVDAQNSRVAVEETDDLFEEAELPAVKSDPPAPDDSAPRIESNKKAVANKMAQLKRLLNRGAKKAGTRSNSCLKGDGG